MLIPGIREVLSDVEAQVDLLVVVLTPETGSRDLRVFC